jgi:hypothetical protein
VLRWNSGFSAVSIDSDTFSAAPFDPLTKDQPDVPTVLLFSFRVIRSRIFGKFIKFRT